MCLLNAWAGDTYVMLHAVRHFAAQYPLTAWNSLVIGGPDSLPNHVQEYLRSGANCTALIGPGYSSIAVAMSPLVPADTVWVDHAASSTELSNKAFHPRFSRTIPTDDINAGAVAVAIHSWGWNLANVLCADEPYGRSVANGFSTAFAALGGTIELSRCYSPDATNETVVALLNEVYQRESRVLFLAGHLWDGLLHALDVTRAVDRLTLIFTEVSCTNATLTRYPGSLCANYEPDPTFVAFERAYLARNYTADTQLLLAKGSPAGDVTVHDDTRPYGPFIADAVHLAMEAVSTYDRANKTKFPDIVSYARALPINGYSGPVVLGRTTGDRAEARLEVYNSRPAADGGWQVLGVMNGNTFVPGSALTTTGGFWYNSFYSTTPPSHLHPKQPAPKPVPYWIIPVAILGLLVILAPIVAKAKQSVAAAKWPSDPDEPFAVMFVGTKNEAAVTEAFPTVIGRAHAAVAKVIRAACARHGCVEARRVGDGTVMVVSKSPRAAMRCAVEIVNGVHAIAWDTVLPVHERIDQRLRDVSDSDTIASDGSRRTSRSRASSQGAAHKSSRRSSGGARSATYVQETFKSTSRFYPNIGIHFGKCHIDRDDELGTFSYTGDTVSIAAEVADNALKHHVLVTGDVVSFLDASAENMDGEIEDFLRLQLTSRSHRGHAEIPTFSFLAAGLVDREALDAAITAHVEKKTALTRKQSGALSRAGDSGAEHSRAGVKSHVGSISGALMQASTGVSMRKIAVVSVAVPALVRDMKGMTLDERQRRIAKVTEVIAGVAATRRVHVDLIADGVALLTVNTTSATVAAMPIIRAAATALEIDATLTALGYASTYAGIASGQALVGSVAELRLVSGGVVHHASQLRAAAAQLKVPALGAGDTAVDLFTHFSMATVDVANLTNIDGETRRARLVAVIGSRGDDEVDGEWLYNVATAESNTEQLFKKFHHGETSHEQLAADQDAMPPVCMDGATSTPPGDVDDAGHNASLEAEITALAAARLRVALAATSVDDYAEQRAAELGVGRKLFF